ncbi:MAG: hypothetical protein V9H69_04420, partial [Anaerolineae bacterium]
RSPFTVHRSPFTVHRSPFTVHRSPFTVHRSPFTAKRPTMPSRPRIHFVATGGTIAMRIDQATGGAVPALTGAGV